MIQSAQVASKFTLFTHHAKTFPNLVTALRNSMLRAGVFKDEKTAEEQVVQVLNFDIHLIKDEYTFDHRKEKTLEGKFDKFFDNATIFFTKETNRELYKHRNILEFVDDSYVLTNPISPENIKGMRENMNDRDMIEFDKFLERVWGIRPPKIVHYDENGNEIKETENVPVAEQVQASSESARKVSTSVQTPRRPAQTGQTQRRTNPSQGNVRRTPRNGAKSE